MNLNDSQTGRDNAGSYTYYSATMFRFLSALGYACEEAKRESTIKFIPYDLYDDVGELKSDYLSISDDQYYDHEIKQFSLINNSNNEVVTFMTLDETNISFRLKSSDGEKDVTLDAFRENLRKRMFRKILKNLIIKKLFKFDRQLIYGNAFSLERYFEDEQKELLEGIESKMGVSK